MTDYAPFPPPEETITYEVAEAGEGEFSWATYDNAVMAKNRRDQLNRLARLDGDPYPTRFEVFLVRTTRQQVTRPDDLNDDENEEI